VGTHGATAGRIRSLDINGHDQALSGPRLTAQDRELARILGGQVPADEAFSAPTAEAMALSEELRAGATRLRLAREDIEAFRSELAAVSQQLESIRAQLVEIGVGLSHMPPAESPALRPNGFRAGGLDPRLASLSQREREVMDGIVGGEMNKNISKQLGISLRTVEHHRQSVMRKMGVRNVATLVRQVGSLPEEQTVGAPVPR
jgi:DNA-binding NarL/FixJ family response regulator